MARFSKARKETPVATAQPRETEAVSSGERQERRRLGVQLGAVAGVADLLREPRQGVDQREDRQPAALLRQLGRRLGGPAGDAVGDQLFDGVVRLVAESLFHRPRNDADEAVAALVALGDQPLDEPADFVQPVAHLGGVLAGELDDLGRVPDDVVLADRLEPEGLDAEAPAADLRVPDEEAGRKRLAFDLGPAGRVDQEGEQVLFAAVEPRRPAAPFLGRLEVGGELRDDTQQVGVPEPGVAHPVQRPDGLARGEQLDRFAGGRERLG